MVPQWLSGQPHRESICVRSCFVCLRSDVTGTLLLFLFAFCFLSDPFNNIEVAMIFGFQPVAMRKFRGTKVAAFIFKVTAPYIFESNLNLAAENVSMTYREELNQKCHIMIFSVL